MFCLAGACEICRNEEGGLNKQESYWACLMVLLLCLHTSTDLQSEPQNASKHNAVKARSQWIWEVEFGTIP